MSDQQTPWEKASYIAFKADPPYSRTELASAIRAACLDYAAQVEKERDTLRARVEQMREALDWALKKFSDCAQCCGYGGWDVEEFEKREQVLDSHRKEHGP